MKNELLSVGIDIGTTTSQVVFSKITVVSTAATAIPEVKITDKTIVYKSEIYFTPLVSRYKIDLKRLKEIIAMEYAKAGVEKAQIATGAIIITGETARKENAAEVLAALSDFAGDFVVATAGPDLESILAGCGAGAQEVSNQGSGRVVNFDIGGGTTNAAVFDNGEIVDSFALDIGGRLIQLDDTGKVTYISEKIASLIAHLDLQIAVGCVAEFDELKKLTDTFAKMLWCLTIAGEVDAELAQLFIGHQHKGIAISKFMFSGGVAEFIYSDEEIKSIAEVCRFGDIGPLLGWSIRQQCSGKAGMIEPKEKIRATVIGAGSYSVKISGSTVVFNDAIVPLKNVPIIRLHEITNMQETIAKRVQLYEDIPLAISFAGPKSPSYQQVKTMAAAIVGGMQANHHPLIVIVDHDFAKALGQSIENLLQGEKALICIDKISVDNGDYIDLGKSVSNVVPVVVKTLIFKSE